MATMSEVESKRLLAEHGLPVLDERTALDRQGAVAAAEAVGFPCVMKLCGDSIAHKTERNLVRLGIGSAAEADRAAEELLGAARPDDGDVSLLIAPMVTSSREFIVGADRSAEFGPVVMVGVGGIFAEVVQDVVFRLVPVTDAEIDSMLDDLASQALLGPFRGEPAIDRTALGACVRAVAQAMRDRDDIRSIDVNPVLIDGERPVAVDALVELA